MTFDCEVHEVFSMVAIKAVVVVQSAWSRARLSRREDGASLVEYAFLVGLIALVCIAAVTFFGHRTSAKFSMNASAIEGAHG